ncbi:MAG: GAF domain-containing protein [Nitrospira sp.]|nr:GAF domain-containing protein [Nitrospira sp.]
MTLSRSPQLTAPHTDLWSLRQLTQFVQDIATPTTLSVVVQRILAGLLDVSQSSHGALYLLDHDHDRYRHMHSHGQLDTVSTPSVIALSDPFIQNLLQVHQTLLASNPDSASLMATFDNDTTNPFGTFPATLVIPLVTRERMVAFVVFRSRAETSCNPHNKDLLIAMAQSAANALDALLMYEHLRQSQTLMRRTDRLRSLEIIAGGFAHEIRNPLTSIKTFIQLAPERKDDSRFIEEFSHIVLDDVNRIERLVQELHDYARYMEPKLTDEDLNEIVSSCAYFIQAQADRRGIKIEKELASELPRGMLDRQQIKQVMLNLLLNAMDAIGENSGTIRVRTHQLRKANGQEWAHIEIEDTGHGIPSEHLDHIFDPFFTTKHASAFNEGTGLGLTIAHQIIQEHRGNIQVQSTEGVGTTLHIQLPTQGA